MGEPIAAPLFVRRTSSYHMIKVWLDAAVTLRLKVLVRDCEIKQAHGEWTEPGWEILCYDVPIEDRVA